VAYWAATQLQPRRERKAQHFLELFGYEVYLPRVRRYWIRHHHRVEVLRPYLPGYCFTRIELQWPRQCPGVIRLVKIGDEPARVPDEVIDAIRRLERDGAIDPPQREDAKALKIGDRVQVVSGVFAGHSGLCARVESKHVEVLLFILGSQRRVQLRRHAVRAV
jgi:transcription antitermination factor NusG